MFLKNMNIRKKKTAANIVIVSFILCGLLWIGSLFIHIGGEYTNNAQVRQDIVPVLSRVQGFIKKIYFDEFQYVHKGDILVAIEDSEFRLKLAQAQADCREVEIMLENAETEYKRYKNLLEKKAVTNQQFDAVETHYKSLKTKLEDNEKNIGVCQAALDLAKLNLSYTLITASCDGYTSSKAIYEGELVMPGKHLISIVDDREKWIIANYRETQMKNICPGNKVDIKIDAFPKIKFEGIVAAVSGATGAQFSVVHSDNSAGNFVKVEQRVPVKIFFTDNNDAAFIARIASGMNAECTIKY